MKKYLHLLSVIIIGVLTVVGTVSAATTISTDIITDGKIGIGTSTPYAKLSVAGQAVVNNIWATSTTEMNYFGGNVGLGTTTTSSGNLVSIQSDGAMAFYNSTGVLNGEIWPGGAVGTRQLIFNFEDVTGATTINDNWAVFRFNSCCNKLFLGADSSNAYITASNRALRFSSQVSTTSPQMTLTTTGNLGIGTTTPATKLHISSGASATTTVTIGELSLTSSKGCVNINRSDGGAGSFYLNGAGALVSEANYCR